MEVNRPELAAGGYDGDLRITLRGVKAGDEGQIFEHSCLPKGRLRSLFQAPPSDD